MHYSACFSFCYFSFKIFSSLLVFPSFPYLVWCRRLWTLLISNFHFYSYFVFTCFILFSLFVFYIFLLHCKINITYLLNTIFVFFNFFPYFFHLILRFTLPLSTLLFLLYFFYFFIILLFNHLLISFIGLLTSFF